MPKETLVDKIKKWFGIGEPTCRAMRQEFKQTRDEAREHLDAIRAKASEKRRERELQTPVGNGAGK